MHVPQSFSLMTSVFSCSWTRIYDHAHDNTTSRVALITSEAEKRQVALVLQSHE